MKYGDILFFAPVNFEGEVIAFWDGSPFSHVGLYWGEFDGVHMFIDADSDGVRMRPLIVGWRNFIAVSPEEPMQEDLGSLLIDHYGAKYDWMHLFQLGIEKATFGAYKAPKTDDHKFICSELVNHVYGFMSEEKATPSTLWNFLKNKNNQQ